MNERVKKLLREPGKMTLYSCLELEYIFTRYIHKCSGFVVTEDYETYFFIDCNKCQMNIYLYENVEEERDSFIELCDVFFGQEHRHIQNDGELNYSISI